VHFSGWHVVASEGCFKGKSVSLIVSALQWRVKMSYLKFLGVFIVVVSMYLVLVNNYNIIHKSKVYLIDGHYNMKSVG
jgi:hypothetical protein